MTPTPCRVARGIISIRVTYSGAPFRVDTAAKLLPKLVVEHEIETELSDVDCQDKKSLLTAYEFCPEVYRKRFRALSKTTHETYSDFAFKLTTVFQR